LSLQIKYSRWGGSLKSKKIAFLKIAQDLGTKGSFIQNASYNSLSYIILIGTQIIFTPLIARIYDPATYGLFATILALSMNVATIFGLRMESLVFIEKEASQKKFIVKFLSGTSFFLSVFLFIICMILHELPFNSTSLFKSPYFLFFPLITFIQVVFTLTGNETTVAKAFKSSFIWSIPVNIGSKIYSLSYGYLTKGNIAGLLVSEVLLRGGYMLTRIKLILKKDFKDYFYFSKTSFQKGLQLIKRYKQFPIFELPVVYFNVFTSQIHIYVLAFLNQKSIIGWAGMAFTLLDAPMRLFAYSVSPVLIQKCSELIDNRKEFSYRLIKVLYFFSMVAAIPFIVILFVGPPLFSWAFGHKWLIAGKIAAAFSIFYIFKMEFDVLDDLLSILQLQKFKFRIALINNSLKIGSILFIFWLIPDPLKALSYWAIFNAFTTCMLLFLEYRMLHIRSVLLVVIKLLMLFLAIFYVTEII
jgi:O-antigen/teichoic acid export membrane protein